MVSASFKDLWNRELVPYRIMIPAGLPAIMTGHLAFPEVTDGAVPASLSRYFVHDVLRKKLGFDGIVLTDDVYMEGAQSYGDTHDLSFPELCLKALKAGNDMIMLSQTPDFDGPIWNTILAEYRSDESFRGQVRESVRRIISTKLEYLRLENRVALFPDPTDVRRQLPSRAARKFFLDQAARSVTVIKDTHLPYEPGPNERVLLASEDELFLEEGKRRYPSADTFLFDNDSLYYSTRGDRRRFRQRSKEYDVVIYNLADQNSFEVLKAAEGIDAEVIVVSSLTPVYLTQIKDVDTALAIYGWGAESYRAGFAALKGDFEAEGTLPITLTDSEK
jgi:beta-N-acetylhexosaminidase